MKSIKQQRIESARRLNEAHRLMQELKTALEQQLRIKL